MVLHQVIQNHKVPLKERITPIIHTPKEAIKTGNPFIKANTINVGLF